MFEDTCPGMMVSPEDCHTGGGDQLAAFLAVAVGFLLCMGISGGLAALFREGGK